MMMIHRLETSSHSKLTDEREWPRTSMEPFFVSLKSWKKRSSLYLVTGMDKVPGIYPSRICLLNLEFCVSLYWLYIIFAM